MESSVSRDNLTKFYTEKTFMELLDNEIIRSKRYGLSLALLVMRFTPSSSEAKNYSHYQVLKKCSSIVDALIRKNDIPGRMSDKLVLAIPEKGEDGAKGMASRILDQVKDLHFTAEDYDFSISCEIGVALYPEKGKSAAELLHAAEEALESHPIKD